MAATVDILDKAGAPLWLGDAVTTPDGPGKVISLAQSAADNTNDSVGVILDADGSAHTYPALLLTIVSKATELASTADQSQDGEVA